MALSLFVVVSFGIEGGQEGMSLARVAMLAGGGDRASWVSGAVDLIQHPDVDLGVDLRGGQFGVSQHGLDEPDDCRPLSCPLNGGLLLGCLRHLRFSSIHLRSRLIHARICSTYGRSSSGAPYTLPRLSTGFIASPQAASEPSRRIL